MRKPKLMNTVVIHMSFFQCEEFAVTITATVVTVQAFYFQHL